ncbi:coiled-coil and C2 domain-containing protein 1A isoform X2 [Hyla sarda]|uniref:coiled-coil and C2 domain-containing protein 1A isoform X2 n=1 Tax=Hyla sarda TaxID=327740 RepID=UPI0024C371AB|nr:coiled-coil and C2 domain-containing protein 1A isoform X2 [Hyla sarda]
MNGRREARGGGRGGRPPAGTNKAAPFLLGFPNAGDSDDDGSLEAELMAITGANKAAKKEKGKTPLPMEHIERMAALCMQDVDEDVDDDLEDDDELMAELNDVLGEDNEEEEPKAAPTPPKTLEGMLRTVKRGGSVSAEDMPPLVATGKTSSTPPASAPAVINTPDSPTSPSPAVNGLPAQVPVPTKTAPPVPTKTAPPVPTKTAPPVPTKSAPPVPMKPQSLPQPVTIAAPTMSSAPLTPSPASDENKTRVMDRQREYKLAAIQSKQQGDTELATKYYRIAKSLDPMLSALDSGQMVDLAKLPPPPDQLAPSKTTIPQSPVSAAPSPSSALPPPPKDTMEALQQRMDRYRSAADQAKAKGDDRKARMHERIVKQYQDAIRSHKAGKQVDLAELPVPPGFPPIHGSEAVSQEQSLVGVLETAMKLANRQDGDGDDDDDDDEEEEEKKGPAGPQKPATRPGPGSSLQPAAPRPSPPKSPKLTGKAQQQLQFLEGRKKQLLSAALRSKQHKDMEGAKMYLRQSKGLDPMIEAARGGLPVDITKVPPAPVNQEDFTLDRKGQSSEKYTKLIEQLKKQHEMCMSYSQQFTHLGNITETAKYEKLAEECMKYIETVKQAHSRGLPVPHCHYEERTVSIVKIFPELTNSDLVLYVKKAVNLPTGSSPSDMDTYVRFEFAYPSLEEAQRDKTNVLKGTNSPVYKEKFNLQINRNHRGLKRAIQAKGIKFEVIQKGGLFKSDRVLGTAHLKLETLDNTCEIRDILEVMDGRRPTGGKLEVCVRIREPFTSQQLSSSTEKWLVVEPISLPPPPASKPKQPTHSRSSSDSPQTLHCLSVLVFEKEKLEKKVLAYRQQNRAPPNDLIALLNDVTQRREQQMQQLRHGGPAIRGEYVRQLERYLQFYSDSARRLGQEGNREAAKEALYKRNLVGNELQKMSR